MSEILQDTVSIPIGNGDACKNTTITSANATPWSAHKYASEKTELLKYAVQYGSKVPVIRAARSVFGQDIDSDGAEAQTARRFFQSHRSMFKIRNIDGFQWVEPRPAAFDLISSMYSAKPTDCDGTPDTVSAGSSQSPRQVVKKVIDGRTSISSDKVRGLLLHSLATRREQTEDSVIILEHEYDKDRYLAVPYTTRFNSSQTLRLNKYHTAWEMAAERYNKGVVLTLTSDPKRQSSLLESTNGLYHDIQRLRSWLSNDPKNGPSRLGRRVPTVVVPEFTDSGHVHAHVVFFDTGWVAEKNELSQYWDQNRGRGRIVDFQRIESRDGDWLWASNVNRKRPEQYLAKTLYDLSELAKTRPKALRKIAEIQQSEMRELDAKVSDWWKLVLYWATELRIFTVSPSITPNTSEQDSEVYTQWWSFVGVLDIDAIPENIREGLVFEPSRPPRQPPPTCVA